MPGWLVSSQFSTKIFSFHRLKNKTEVNSRGSKYSKYILKFQLPCVETLRFDLSKEVKPASRFPAPIAVRKQTSELLFPELTSPFQSPATLKSWNSIECPSIQKFPSFQWKIRHGPCSLLLVGQNKVDKVDQRNGCHAKTLPLCCGQHHPNPRIKLIYTTTTVNKSY